MGLIFVSTAIGLWAFPMALGQKLQWRLNDSVANPVLLGLVAMLVFILGSVFLQPRAYEAGKSVSFVGLTTVCEAVCVHSCVYACVPLLLIRMHVLLYPSVRVCCARIPRFKLLKKLVSLFTLILNRLL